MPYLRRELELDVTLLPVKNRFWGESVTVSGLLTGKDLLDQAGEMDENADVFVLPPNCLNHDNLFLDDMSLEQFAAAVNRPVIVGKYNLAETLTEVAQ